MKIAVSTSLPVPVVRSSQKMRRRSRTSPFRPPPCSSADPNSTLFVFPHLHRLIVALLHILMNSDDNRHCKAPPPPTGARGRSHNDKSRSLSSGAWWRVYKPNRPLLELFPCHSSRAMTNLNKWHWLLPLNSTSAITRGKEAPARRYHHYHYSEFMEMIEQGVDPDSLD